MLPDPLPNKEYFWDFGAVQVEEKGLNRVNVYEQGVRVLERSEGAARGAPIHEYDFDIVLDLLVLHINDVRLPIEVHIG